MSKRSDLITKGPERAPPLAAAGGRVHRLGQWQPPIIGIANSFNEIIPGHSHLDKLVDERSRPGFTPPAGRLWSSTPSGFSPTASP